MSIKLGVIMDPIEHINPKKDTTLALLLEAKARKWPIAYMQMHDLFLENDEPMAHARSLTVFDSLDNWYEIHEKKVIQLADLDLILMRKDPPVSESYLYTTLMLDLAEKKGCLVVNKPASLRNLNEKLAANLFPALIPATLVTSQKQLLSNFVKQHQEVIFKPLNAMGGKSIFYLKQGNPNLNVIIETMTQDETLPIMAQRFIPEISNGDKRILVIDGKPFHSALARIPSKGEHRGNLAVGGSGITQVLSKRDYEIAEAVGPYLQQMGVIFAGIDVIGDYLTEINVTSPTCIREISAATGENIAKLILDSCEAKIKEAKKSHGFSEKMP